MPIDYRNDMGYTQTDYYEKIIQRQIRNRRSLTAEIAKSAEGERIRFVISAFSVVELPRLG